MKNKKRIGLIGFGCVGEGFYHILNDQKSADFEIVNIAVKQKKQRNAPESLFIYDPFILVNDPTIDLIIELIDDANLAFEIVEQSLKNGKDVISANKKMVAENLEELIRLQKQYNRTVLYEGAVCGAIPIIQVLDQYHSHDKIESITGIFNGSSNYILSKINQEGLSYELALEEAQKLGFAETDPTLDVGGYDPAFKLSIITHLAYGVYVPPKDILTVGINQLSDYEFKFAADYGFKIKLLARVIKHKNSIHLLVAPHFIHKSEAIFNIENEFNAVQINGEFSGEQLLSGKGAGSLPTGMAVFADLIKLGEGNQYSYKEASFSLEDSTVTAYVNHGREPIDINLFENVHERFTGKERNYIIGEINTHNLNSISEKENIHMVLLTKESTAHVVNRFTYSYA